MVSARSICRSADCGFAQRRASAVGAGCRGEVAALLSIRADKLTDDARQRLLRHGHVPELQIMTVGGWSPARVRRKGSSAAA